jgi:hypothetical protein
MTIEKLGKMLDSVPEFNRARKTRAIAIVTVGEKGELDVLRLGMTKEQFNEEILPALSNPGGE